jgi:hypothetical protein
MQRLSPGRRHDLDEEGRSQEGGMIDGFDFMV